MSSLFAIKTRGTTYNYQLLNNETPYKWVMGIKYKAVNSASYSHFLTSTTQVQSEVEGV